MKVKRMNFLLEKKKKKKKKYINSGSEITGVFNFKMSQETNPANGSKDYSEIQTEYTGIFQA